MKRNFLNKKKAQELVEFAIVVPILMMILFIVVEFGSALNARITVGEAIKIALVKVNNLSSLDGNKAAKEAFVENYITNEVVKYLILHNIPNSGSVTTHVKVVNGVSGYATILVNYQYHPYFLLSGLFGNHVLDSIPFSSSQTLNPHIFEDNVFSAASAFPAFTTYQLSKFHTDGAGNFIDTGALVDGNYNGAYDVREHTAFLLHFYGGIGTHPNLEYDLARLVSWQGNDLLPPNLRINLKTGTLETRSPYYNSGVWFDTKIPYIWVVSSMGINHLIFTKYNSYQMLLADTSSLLYKLRFNTTDSFYNRAIRFCGTTGSSGACNGDQRGRATVNERTLRMNPRLGDVVDGDPDTGDNSYLIGTMEPIDTTIANFGFVNSYYFSYTGTSINATTLLDWDSANWENQDFITISSPWVKGLQNNMANGIYIPDITDSSKNPFYTPYQYRLKMCEALNGGNCTPQGVYLGPAAPANDGNIDANNVIIGPWDAVEPGGDWIYTMDIVDVYTDSDGDGIPDAWDRDPAYPDANVNGILDGNEIVNINPQHRCNDGIGDPLEYGPDDWGTCKWYKNAAPIDDITIGDIINGHTAAAGDFTPYNASPGEPFYDSTPYNDTTGVLQALEAPGDINIPAINPMNLVVYNPSGPHKAIYYDLGGGHYTRQHPSWWSELCLFFFFTNSNDKFSSCNVKVRRLLKTHNNNSANSYIHGTATPAIGPTDITLDPSDELQYLYNNTFQPSYRVKRTPPTVW